MIKIGIEALTVFKGCTLAELEIEIAKTATALIPLSRYPKDAVFINHLKNRLEVLKLLRRVKNGELTMDKLDKLIAPF